MARNGSGTYNLLTNSWNPATNGVSATAVDWQNLINDVASALTQSLSADGQTPMTGNLNAGNNKITGLAAGSATGDSLRWEQLFSQGQPANLASAATTDIGAQNTVLLNITGTTTITSFGTNYNGPRYLRFDGVQTLTHNATTLILPGGANITTAAGDSAIVVPNGTPANGWRVLGYERADGTTIATSKIQPISASVSGNALTISASSLTLDFRSTTLGSGTVTTVTGTPANLVISSGSTLGTTNGAQSDIVVLAINNAGTIELAAVNLAGGTQLDEINLVTTTAEGGAGAADSATVIYSTTARTNVAYRVLGIVRSTQATAGTWATAPSLIQGSGGNNIVGLSGQLVGFWNKIINGKMDISQRGTSFAGLTAASNYTLDRWTIIGQASTAVATITQNADVPSSNEFQNSLRFAVTTADTSISSTDLFSVAQHIEGYNVRDLIGRTFTLSFWVRSGKTGTHCVSFRNNGADRSYVVEYTISAANTWEFKTVTVPGGLITAGTWDWTNNLGLAVNWVLACGTTFHTTAGAWQTSNFLATSNQVNCLDTVGNIFAITGVQLEPGSVATPFEHRPFGAELALCQRYFCKTFDYGTAPAQNLGTNGSINFVSQAAQIWDAMWRFPVEMRVTPTTVTTFSTNAASANWSTNTDTPTASVSVIGAAGLSIRASTPGAAGRAYFIHATASAEL